MVQFVDRAKMTTATTGTGPLTLGTAVTGYQGFAAAGVTDQATVRYVIEDGFAWEIGLGVYTAANTSLSRAPIESSNAGGAIALDGSAVVYVTAAGPDLALMSLSYANRGNLRSIEWASHAVVESLGDLIWTPGSAEPDDDETCLATPNGAWTLYAPDPDEALSAWVTEVDAVQGQVTALQAFQAAFLAGTFAMTLTTLAATMSATFTVTIAGASPGNSVMVTPGNSFGNSTTDQAYLSETAFVSAANTVTVSIRNAGAAAAAMTPSTWKILVVAQ